MNKSKFTGGFIYHPASEQFLLQKLQEQWDLIPKKILDTTKASKKSIRFVYEYLEAKSKQNRYIFYIESQKLINIKAKKGLEFIWINLKQISKLPIPLHVKQDIIVGKRVIDSTIRKESGERTID